MEEMFTKRSLFVSLSLLLVFGLSVSLSAAQDNITISWLTHWGEENLLEAQQAIIDEYEAANPGVTIELRTVPFDQLLTTIITGRTAGTNPDVYHFYNLWMPEFVSSGLLAAPPEDVVETVTTNAAPAAVQGTTVNGQVWGTPTEINTYLLLYNKRLLEEAGFSEPPADWDELEEIAAAITQRDETGAVTQVGFGVITGWDSGVVHPFTSLLYSDGGNYLSDDFSATAFNSAEGLETLQLYADMLANGGMDLSVAGMAEFPNGKVGMIIMANWWRATLQAAEGIDYDTEVGVAPIPVGPSGEETSTLSYNWLLGVDSSSPNQEAAWAFVRWLNTPRAEGEASPIGDYLVNALGAIPSFVYDQEAFAEDLSDHFLTPFVESTSYARPEPVVAGGQEVKTRLQAEIEAVWTGLSDPQTALEIAASEGDTILAEMAQGGE
jgi:multiple sugar transport system substrate-binding protein